MDISDYRETQKRCYKCEQPVLQNLNIALNTTNTTIVLWNKFQLFIYENFQLDSASKIIIPDFQIQRLISSSNYLICLDCTGNLYVTSLKFKNHAQKRLRPSFQARGQNIVTCVEYSDNLTLTLQCESNTYFLLLNKTNTEFNLEKKVLLTCKEDLHLSSNKEKNIFISYLVNQEYTSSLKTLFSLSDNIKDDWNIVLMSFDKINIYACLCHPKMAEDQITLLKLYTCPSEICSMDIIQDSDINIIIGLTIGTIIRLSLKEYSRKPEVLHLNVALHKLLVLENSVIYTDGITMWKTDMFSTTNMFEKLFVKHVKDFIVFGDQIICTTFTNLIYTFQIDDKSSYVKLQTVDEYCAAEKLLNNADYLQRIMEEVDKNDKVIAKLNTEGNYITALALSNRQDIMNDVISCKATVYESYNDAITDNSEAKLTEDFVKYHDEQETYLFVISILNITQNKLKDVLSNKVSDLKIHITISIETTVLKITSVTMTETLKEISLIIPLAIEDKALNQINVDIKLILNIPAPFDAKQTIWTVLYQQNIKLNSEHFISTNPNSSKTICLKEPQKSLEVMVLEYSMQRFGNLFEFKNDTVCKQYPFWLLYVKLPDDYKDKLQAGCYYEKYYSKKRVAYFLKQFSCKEFYNSKSDVIFVIKDHKIKISIENDGFSGPLMKISCENMMLALSIRNFIVNVIYDDFNINSGLNINHTFYNTVENLQKAVRECSAGSSQSKLLSIIEQFERHIIGGAPI